MSIRKRNFSLSSSHLAKGTALGSGNLRYKYEPDDGRRYIITGISTLAYVEYFVGSTVDLSFLSTLYSRTFVPRISGIKEYDQFATAGVVIDEVDRIILDRTRFIADTTLMTVDGIFQIQKQQILDLYVPFSQSYPLYEDFAWSGTVAGETSRCYRVYNFSALEFSDQTEFDKAIS